jgi:hypothetical protein
LLLAAVLLYSQCGYVGLLGGLSSGSYKAAALQALGLDGMRSLSITPGYKVTLYSDSLGSSNTFTSSVPCLDAYGLNGTTSKIIITSGVVRACNIFDTCNIEGGTAEAPDTIPSGHSDVVARCSSKPLTPYLQVIAM